MTNKFYRSTKWIKKREAILRRDSYECRHCKRFGKTTLANTVHHVYPLEHYPEYRLNTENLISVCGNCHNTFHDRDTHELTEQGNQWVERLKNKIK